MVNASRRFPCVSSLRARSWLRRRRSRTRNAWKLRDFIKQETAGPDKYVDTFYFRQRSSGRQRADARQDTRPSAGICRNAGCSCIATTRNRASLLRGEPRRRVRPASRTCRRMRPPTISGRPAPALPRCASASKDFTAPELLRYWANRELGSSSILYTASPDGPGFQFLFTDDQDWIIIEDDKDQSCFYDRGTDMMLRFNTTLINFLRGARHELHAFPHRNRRRRRRPRHLGLARPFDERAQRRGDRGDRQVRGSRSPRDADDQGRRHHLGQGRFFRRRRPLDAERHGRAIREDRARRRAKKRR